MIKTFFGTRILHITELIGLLFCYFKQILKVCTYVLLFKYRSSLFFFLVWSAGLVLYWVSISSVSFLQDNDLTLLMKRELKKLFEDCKMIAVVQNSSSSAEDMMTLRHRLYKHNITVKFFPNKVRLALLILWRFLFIGNQIRLRCFWIIT